MSAQIYSGQEKKGCRGAGRQGNRLILIETELIFTTKFSSFRILPHSIQWIGPAQETKMWIPKIKLTKCQDFTFIVPTSKLLFVPEDNNRHPFNLYPSERIDRSCRFSLQVIMTIRYRQYIFDHTKGREKCTQNGFSVKCDDNPLVLKSPPKAVVRWPMTDPRSHSQSCHSRRASPFGGVRVSVDNCSTALIPLQSSFDKGSFKKLDC